MPEEERDFVDLCKESTFIFNSFKKKAFNKDGVKYEIDEEYSEMVESFIDEL